MPRWRGDGRARAALRDAPLGVLEEWFDENAVRVEYPQVRAVIE